MTSDNTIVGAGSGGAVLAARLSEDPARHVLLGRPGPDYPTIAQTPQSALDGRRTDRHSHDRGSTRDGAGPPDRVPARENKPPGRQRLMPLLACAGLELPGKERPIDSW